MIKPDDPSDIGNAPDSRSLGWFVRLVLFLVVPKTDREELEGDLLEEYQEICQKMGLVRATRWLREQVAPLHLTMDPIAQSGKYSGPSGRMDSSRG